MSGLSAGLATFNSCNKAGSIPHFTKHLSRYPCDYQALKWRGRAYSIVGKIAEARADFQNACRVSSGSQNLLAQALLELIDGKREKSVAILQKTTRQYPNCSEAWHQLGSHIDDGGDKAELSLQYLERAKQLATMNSETKDPWYPWCCQKIGDIYFFKKQQVNEARKHYEAAVQSSSTLTVGHLGLSRCDILNNDLARAETSFLTAKRLNPVLVQSETFDDFCRQVRTRYDLASMISEFSKLFSDLLTTELTPSKTEAVHQLQIEEKDTSLQDISGAGARYTTVQSSRSASGDELLTYHRQQERSMAPSFNKTRQQHSSGSKSSQAQSHGSSHRSVSGGKAGGSSGNGGSGDGSDDEDSSVPKAEREWKRIKKEAPSAKKYRGKRFYQSVDKENWYSKIGASERHGHGKKAYLKKYVDRGRTIELIGSVDEDYKLMTEKHESGKYEVIKKSDMQGIF